MYRLSVPVGKIPSAFLAPMAEVAAAELLAPEEDELWEERVPRTTPTTMPTMATMATGIPYLIQLLVFLAADAWGVM